MGGENGRQNVEISKEETTSESDFDTSSELTEDKGQN